MNFKQITVSLLCALQGTAFAAKTDLSSFEDQVSKSTEKVVETGVAAATTGALIGGAISYARTGDLKSAGKGMAYGAVGVTAGYGMVKLYGKSFDWVVGRTYSVDEQGNKFKDGRFASCKKKAWRCSMFSAASIATVATAGYLGYKVYNNRNKVANVIILAQLLDQNELERLPNAKVSLVSEKVSLVSEDVELHPENYQLMIYNPVNDPTSPEFRQLFAPQPEELSLVLGWKDVLFNGGLFALAFIL